MALGSLFALPFTILGRVMSAQAQSDANTQNLAELGRAQGLEQAAGADALWRGTILSGAARQKGSEAIAAQRVAYSASGVDATVGTPANVAAGTRLVAEHEATQLSNNAVREAWGHEEVGRKYRIQSAALQKQQDNLGLSTGIAIGGDLAAAAGDVAGTILGG